MIVILRVLAVVQVFISAFAAMVAGFADGGQWWERLNVAVHPVAAILLLMLVFSKESPKGLAIATVGLLALNIVADGMLALAIGTGAIKGDWWLPLVFSAIPVFGLIYFLPRMKLSGP
ncbi:MAG: hypothetical protein F4196_01835 [Acidimicrobiia bacterium]|nr:hypothetical protein [bacterium]MYG91627.1 hypothetical protein [Acidimicrobiia bacterium]